MSPLNWKVMTWSLGLFATVTFVICVIYGLVMPTALHVTQFLEITLPGFRWLSIGSFILGCGVAPSSGRGLSRAGPPGATSDGRCLVRGTAIAGSDKARQRRITP